MYIIHTGSGKHIKVAIAKINASEIAFTNKSKLFDFNWNKEKLFDVYKLIAESIEVPLGLLSLHNRPIDHAIEIRLLAVSKANVGDTKQYERIAGCLIAFACKKAFTAGYGGYVCLKPKTELKRHYSAKYGFENTKLYMITEGRNSLDLIEEYDKDKNN